MIVKVHEKLIIVDVVQNFMAVLEVIQHAQNGAVVVVRSQRRQADVLQGNLLSIVVCLQVLDVCLQI